MSGHDVVAFPDTIHRKNLRRCALYGLLTDNCPGESGGFGRSERWVCAGGTDEDAAAGSGGGGGDAVSLYLGGSSTTSVPSAVYTVTGGRPPS